MQEADTAAALPSGFNTVTRKYLRKPYCPPPLSSLIPSAPPLALYHIPVRR